MTSEDQLGASASRFVIWQPDHIAPFPVESYPAIDTLLRNVGVDSVLSLNGIKVDSHEELAITVARLLQENELGMLVHAYWPEDRGTEARIPKSLGDQSIEILKLSVRSGNCLLNAGISTIRELRRQSRDDLMDLPNMGRTSVAEIERKLAELTLGGASEPDTTPPPDWFSLAILMAFEKCGFPAKIAERLRSAGIPDVHSLLGLMPDAIRVRAGLKPAEMQAIQTRLVTFGLRLGYRPPIWLKEHLKEVRSAFGAEIDRFTCSAEMVASGPSCGISVAPLPNCLEEELEELVPAKTRAQKLPIVRRVLGWDGGAGTTLEIAGKEFDLTRERIRQIVATSVRRESIRQVPFLSRAIDLISQMAPCAAEQAEAALLQHGLVRTPIRAEGILATAGALGIDVSWEVEERNSFRAIVGPGDANRIKAFHREARRRVSHFGVTRTSYVLAEVAGDQSVEFAQLCCSLVSDLRWLDESNDWFWLPTSRNAIASRLAKILRVVPELELHEALVGVLRDRRMHETEIPQAVFRAFCSLMPWCEVKGNRVSSTGDLPSEDERDSNETVLIRILQENGHVMWRGDLWQLASQNGVEKVSFDKYLSESNVIARLGPETYGLVGATAAESMMAVHQPALADDHKSTITGPIEDPPQPDEMPGRITPEPFLESSDPSSVDFPVQFLACCLSRSAPLRRHGVWSLAELQWTESDLQKIRAWGQIGMFDFTEIRGKTLTYGSARLDGAEAVALTFLACCSDIAMERADESEMWATIQSTFAPGLRSRLFQGPGNPKVRIREATERICSKLGIRHVFGREGEQSWRRTVFLQFGITRSGRNRLPWWLTYGSTVPVAVEDLLSSPSLSSGSFGSLWRVLQRYRAGQISHVQAATALCGNPWIPASEVDAVLSAAIERRDLPRSDSAPASTNDENADRLFGSPLLAWGREVPVFEIPVRTGSRWLTELRYVFVLQNGKRVTATRQDAEYRLDGTLQVELTDTDTSIDLRLRQVSCLPEPLRIPLVPEDSDFIFYDLASGEALPCGNEAFVPSHAYALLARSSVDITDDPLEMRRVFGGKWKLRAYRKGIPPLLEIHRNGEVIWTAQDSADNVNQRLIQRFQVACTGGRWGEVATFTVEPISDLKATHLLISGQRVPLEASSSGVCRASVMLTPDLNCTNSRVRVECISRNRVRWFGAQLTMGPVQGIAIEAEDGWKVLRETNDMDAEYLRIHRLVAHLPARFDGETIPVDDWAWMEGPHFCGRPRTSASLIGGTVHAVGEPLRLLPGPYNRNVADGQVIARSVIHSGVVGWIDNTNANWQVQFRRSIELGRDHEIWGWPSVEGTPRLLDRSSWRQEDDICYVQIDSDKPLLSLAVSFEGNWLGSRTSEQGWAGFSNLLRSCLDWSVLAPWLKWWRVPLLHPVLRAEAAALAMKSPVDTLNSWAFSNKLSAPARFSDDYEDAWRMVTQTFLWDWLPTRAEAGEALVALGLLTGDVTRDSDESWTGFEEMYGIHPLLFVQLAARGAVALYPDRSAARITLLEQLRDRLLEINPTASLDTVSSAIRNARQMAAQAMGVDEAFVAKSLLRDAIALVSGNLRSSHNLRVALANSCSVPQYLAAAVLHKMIAGEIS